MKILAIGGEPATGKTTLMRAFLQARTSSKLNLAIGLARAEYYQERKMVVLGIYEGETFDGTDKLSMAVQPHAEALLTLLADPDNKIKADLVAFEGDRLFNASFLSACQKVAPTEIIILKAGESLITSRHLERRDEQSETFIKGRRTKLAHILQEFPSAKLRNNESEQDRVELLSFMLQYERA